jgi:LysR family transcriptional regulator, glycine cleavage system transcriptional activator
MMFSNLTSSSLPSLNALRAFEAMARTGRATLAAEELHVTHSAVSRQVKALEESLGVRLFAGPKHRLELTEAGRALLPALTAAFDQIATAVQSVRAGQEDLHVAVHGSIAVKWLIPRLPDFQALEPGVRLHLLELAPNAVSRRDAQAVVRIVPTALLSDPAVTGFIPNHIGVVMAPALAETHRADLLRAPRLSSQTHLQGWAVWAALAGVELPPAPEQPYAHLHVALDAALAGLGAVVMPWPLVADYVAARRLAAPFGFRRVESAFALLASPGPEPRSLAPFRRWLVAQGAKTPLPPLQ